jgi:hypothetical protein
MDKTKYEEVGWGEIVRTWPEKDSSLTPGQSIEGRYIKKRENVGTKKSNMYILETDDGDVGVWGGAVIDSKFAEIAIGKMVGIEFLGKKKSKSGSTYNDFWVGQGIDVVGDEGGAKKPNLGNLEDDIKSEDLPF